MRLERKILMSLPYKYHAVRWDGRGIAEIESWINSNEHDQYDVSVSPVDQSLTVAKGEVGFEINIPVGDHVLADGDSYSRLEESPGRFTAYPSEWLR